MILLVNPLPSSLAPFPERLSLSLGSLASFLPAGMAEIFYDNGDQGLFLSKAESFEFIGFTGMTYQARRALALASAVKKRFPEKRTVFGGVHASLNPGILLENPELDFVISGEGEEPLLSLLSGNPDHPGIYRIREGKVSGKPAGPHPDITKFPIINRKLIPDQGIFYDQAFSERAAIVMFSRGCVGTCTFCASPAMFGRNPRYRTPEQAVEELKYLSSELGISNFAIEDDNFLSDGEFASFFIHQMQKSGLGIRFRINCRLENLSFGILLHLKKIGLCKITLGIEQIDPLILRHLGKSLDQKKLAEALSWCDKLGILAALLLIAGAPGETRESLRLVSEWVSGLNPSGGYDFQILQPHPGHRIAEICRKTGKILTTDTDDFFSDNITFLPAGFDDPAEFRNLVREVSGKPVKIAGVQEKPFLEQLREKGAETLVINPADYSSSDFNLVTTHWQGSERCSSGLSIIKCRDYGGIEYNFQIKDAASISGFFLHGRFASHPMGFPKGERYSSEIKVILNGVEVSRQVFKSIHTTGEYLRISIYRPGALKEGLNTLRLEVPKDSRLKNGLSIFCKPLNRFFEPYEMPLILEILR
ncbi:MAG: radical SAM protein [Candidatus Wallbacteria bacterium]|nr:radical SAM protein [Candidatus Wallbacteria bacterium]